MGTCEEKSSGIDKVIHAVEAYQLPAPDFRAGHRRTVVTIFGPRPSEGMARDDRVRACYQHCALRWVISERMTNRSLRERFRLPEGKAAIVSQVIAATIGAGLVRQSMAEGLKLGLSRLPRTLRVELPARGSVPLRTLSLHLPTMTGPTSRG